METIHAPRQRTLLLIAMIVFIDVASIGLIIPVLPSLIGGLANVSVDSAAAIGGWLLFSFAVMQCKHPAKATVVGLFKRLLRWTCFQSAASCSRATVHGDVIGGWR